MNQQEKIFQYFDSKNMSAEDFFFKKLTDSNYIVNNTEEIFTIFKDNQNSYFKSLVHKFQEKNKILDNILTYIKIADLNFEHLDILDFYFENLEKTDNQAYERYLSFIDRNIENKYFVKLILKHNLYQQNYDLNQNIQNNISNKTLKEYYGFLHKDPEIITYRKKRKTFNFFLFYSILSVLFLISSIFLLLFLHLFEVDKNIINIAEILSNISIVNSLAHFFLMIIYEWRLNSKFTEKNRNFYYFYDFLETTLKDEDKSTALKYITSDLPQDIVLNFQPGQEKDLKQDFQNILAEIEENEKEIETHNKTYIDIKENQEINHMIDKIVQFIEDNKKISKHLSAVKVFDQYFDNLSQYSQKSIAENQNDILNALENIYSLLQSQVHIYYDSEKTRLKIQTQTLQYKTKEG